MNIDSPLHNDDFTASQLHQHMLLMSSSDEDEPYYWTNKFSKSEWVLNRKKIHKFTNLQDLQTSNMQLAMDVMKYHLANFAVTSLVIDILALGFIY